MSYGPTIETLAQWNDRLYLCGCCEMPVCPVPVAMEQYKFAEVDVETTDYSPSTGETLGAWAPFAEPAGAPTDDLPTIYRVHFVDDAVITYSGSTYYYVNKDDPPYEYALGGYTVVPSGNPALPWYKSGSILMRDFEDWSEPIETWEEGHWIEGSGDTTTWDENITIPYEYSDINTPRLESITANTLVVLTARDYNDFDFSMSDPFTEILTDNTEKKQTDNQELRDPITKDALITAAETAADALAWSGWVVALPIASKGADWPSIEDHYGLITNAWPVWSASASPLPISTAATATARKAKLCFRIPHPFEGTFFQITFDAVFFPTVGEPSVVATDQSLVWTGPGNQADENDASWLTPAYELPTLSAPGTVEIRNIRYICYQETPWGTPPPTPMGAAYP